MIGQFWKDKEFPFFWLAWFFFSCCCVADAYSINTLNCKYCSTWKLSATVYSTIYSLVSFGHDQEWFLYLFDHSILFCFVCKIPFFIIIYHASSPGKFTRIHNSKPPPPPCGVRLTMCQSVGEWVSEWRVCQGVSVLICFVYCRRGRGVNVLVVCGWLDKPKTCVSKWLSINHNSYPNLTNADILPRKTAFITYGW